MKTIRVAAAVIRDGDRFFATARGYGEFEGWWEFPGGKLEPGETPRQALEREIRELRRANEILRTSAAFFAAAELDRKIK